MKHSTAGYALFRKIAIASNGQLSKEERTEFQYKDFRQPPSCPGVSLHLVQSL